MNSRAKVVDVPMHQRPFGTKQVAFVDWGVSGVLIPFRKSGVEFQC